MANIQPEFLESLGIHGFRAVQPKPLWTAHLEKAMSLVHRLPNRLAVLKTLFREELKELVWLEAATPEAELFASAAYPEVPGKVFLTLGVFAYVPPNLVSTSLNFYCAFENMVHECLHHRGEKIFRRSLLIAPWMDSKAQIQVSWRETQWGFSHAIQAYYVYLWIFELRKWYVQENLDSTHFESQLRESIDKVAEIILELEVQLAGVMGVQGSQLRQECLLNYK
ncbi:hypothetical protein [Bdellovibrio sp. HCB337]|uniref:hypothetical protein n=1 Tax=Bdellovibrio sp. HCB337 TaxID=3394358 RepID=UPI0039A4AF3B